MSGEEANKNLDKDKEQRGLLSSFRDELVTIFHKSQDTFEKQLSFITAGSLGLSVGFIKDIVKPFESSSYKGLLGGGWSLLIVTLLLNCISHMLAAKYANTAIKEINEDNYEPEKISSRNKKIIRINSFTVIGMIIGIALIMFFITYNTLI